MQAEPPLGVRRLDVDRVREGQLEALLAVDEAVGRILDALEETGRLPTAMIVLTSDNGFLWGEHRLLRKSLPYEEAIRVPLVLRYDPLVEAPRTDRHLVLTMDLAPTFAELAGAAAPDADGRSLLPLLLQPRQPWRQAFAVERARLGNEAPGFCAVRTRRYLYAAYETGEEELYDLRADPYELANLARDPASAPLLDLLRGAAVELCDPPPPGVVLPSPSPMASTSPSGTP